MARGTTRGATRCALLLIGTIALVLAPTTAARGLLSKTTAAPEMGEQGTVEAKGESQVKAERAPNFWDLVGTASPTFDWTTKFTSAPTKIYTAAPTMDWSDGFTASPTLDWHKLVGTASPTVDWHNLVGTAAPTADWSLAKLIGTSSPTYDWTTFFAKPGSDSAASVDAASVTMSPAKVQAQAVSAASSDADGGFSAFFVMVCAIGSALVGGAIVYKYTSSQKASLESTPLISNAASKSSSESSTDTPAAITATEAPDSSHGYQAV